MVVQIAANYRILTDFICAKRTLNDKEYVPALPRNDAGVVYCKFGVFKLHRNLFGAMILDLAARGNNVSEESDYLDDI